MVLATAATTTGPYKGLTHFNEADAAFFFGRESERDLVVASLKASRLTLVYGQSGAGKSSLLRAGVAASLRAQARADMERFGSAEFIPVVFSNWRDDPVQALAAAIAASVKEFVLRPQAEPTDPEPAEPGAPAKGLVQVIQEAAAATGASLLIVLDQFEEYLLYHRGDEGPMGFAEQFPQVVNQPSLPAGFLLAIREDALAQLDRFRARIPNLFGSYRRIRPLSKQAAMQAIRKPVEEYNRLRPPEEQVSIEPELVTAVVDQVATGEVKLETVGAGSLDGGSSDAVEAPYLQLVMTRIWQQELDAGSHCLRLSTLQALGGAQKIVRSHLDATLSALSAEDQDTAADVFHHLVTPTGTKIAHAVADLVDYTHRAEAKVVGVLDRLGEGDTRIVRAVQPPMGTEGPPRYEIFHDVLAPAVLDWRGRYAARKLLADKERAEQKARVQRRRAIVAWVAAGLAIAVLAVFVVANALSERDSNRSRVLAADSVANLGGDPELSALLALSAMAKSSTPQAEAALRQSFPHIEEERTWALGKSVSATVFSPNGRQVAAATSDDGVVRIWDLGRAAPPWTRRTDFSYINGLAFSPDGREIAVVGQVRANWHPRQWPGIEILSDSPTGKAMPLYPPASADDLQPQGEGVAWQGPAGSGGSLVSVDGNGYICVWDDPSQLAGSRCVQTGFSNLGSVSLDTAGTKVAIAGGSGGTVWSVPGLTKLFPTNGTVWGIGDVQNVLLSPDGRELVTSSIQGITLVNGLYGNNPQLAQFSSGVDIVDTAFNRAGTQLAISTDLGQTTIWQLAQASQIGGVEVAQLDCDCGVVYSTQFDQADPSRIVTGSEDGMVRVWDTRPRELLFSAQESQSLPWAGNADGLGEPTFVSGLGDVVGLAQGESVIGQTITSNQGYVVNLRSGRRTTISARGKPVDTLSISASQARTGQAAFTMAAVVEPNGKAQVAEWRVTNGTGAGGPPVLQPLKLPPHMKWAGEPQTVAISPDGAWLAVSFSNSNQIEIVDLARGRSVYLPKAATHFYFVESMAFDAAGNRVLVSFNNGAAWDWSVDRGASHDSAAFLGIFRDPARDAVVWDAQYSPDGQSIVIADNLGEVTKFDAPKHRVTAQIDTGGGQVNTAVFSPDGSEVVTAGDDGTVRLWSLASRSQVASFGPVDQPFPTAVNSAVFGTYDGQLAVVSASNDGYLRVWSAEAATPRLGLLERAVKGRVTRGYTATERAEFLRG